MARAVTGRPTAGVYVATIDCPDWASRMLLPEIAGGPGWMVGPPETNDRLVPSTCEKSDVSESTTPLTRSTTVKVVLDCGFARGAPPEIVTTTLSEHE